MTAAAFCAAANSQAAAVSASGRTGDRVRSISDSASVNLVDLAIKLSTVELAYAAALQATANTAQLSLQEFLR